jgi:AsmA protein
MPPPPPSSRYRSGPPDDDGGGGLLKIFAIALLVVIGLAGAGAAVLYLAGPADLVRDQIVQRVKRETGRDLVIKGATSFTFYPSLGVSMSDVALSAPPGMTAPPLISIKSLTASVALMPLLKRDVEVQDVRLVEPVLTLQIDPDGRKSWDFAAALSPLGRIRVAQAQSDPRTTTDVPSASIPNGAIPTPQRLTLGDVRVARGTVIYSDQRSGTQETVSGIDLTIAAPSLDGTAIVNGSLQWRDQALDLTTEITSPNELFKSSAARFVTQIKGRPLDVRYEGNVRFGAALDLDGNLALSSPSLHRLAAFALKREPSDAPDRPLAVTGKLTAENNTWTLSGAKAAVDRTKGSGDIAVTTGGARPIIKANLKFAELDLNAILGAPAAGLNSPAPAPISAPSTKPVGPDAPQSIEDLLKANPSQPGTKVRGFSQRAGWSTEPFDFSVLNVVDADARLNVGRLLYKEMKVGQSIAAVNLKAGILKIDFTDVQLYGGHGKGLVAIDASDLAYPRITTNVSLDGVEGLPLLKDAADLDWLAGKAKITAGVTGQGKTQAALMNSLGGSADIAFNDGAIVGINIPGLLRNIGQGKLGGLSSAPTEKTDFSEMTSSWAINNGVARNSDLKLIGPLIRIAGDGAVKLGERSIDYTLKTKIVADARGQGGAIDIGGLEVPLRVQGPWEKPKFAPDLGGVLKDPNKAVETIKEIGKQFKGKDAKEVLKGLFGGGGGEAQ